MDGISVRDSQKYRHRRPYRFLFASEIWVFINLLLALVISVPALNLFTHGTHVIVAHTMGASMPTGRTSIALSKLAFALSI